MTEPKKASQEKSCYRILSLDGGGVRGVLSAWILRNMERHLNEMDGGENRPLGQRFDLIAGTSVGAILALSLAIGKSAEEIVRHWVGDENCDCEEAGKAAFGGGKIGKIFGHPRSLFSWLFFAPKHDSKMLKRELELWFRGKKLNEIGENSKGPHVLVTSTALAKPSLRSWKSPQRIEFKSRADQQLADVAYASAAAPVFFASQTKFGFDAPLADGGLCANNPAVTAIVEAVGAGIPLERIRLVSVGTGTPCGMPYDPGKIGKGGAMRWFVRLGSSPAIPLIELMMEAQSDMAHRQAGFLLEKERYLRVNPQLKFPMKLDEMEKVGYLKAYSDLTREEYAKLGELML